MDTLSSRIKEIGLTKKGKITFLPKKDFLLKSLDFNAPITSTYIFYNFNNMLWF